MSDSPFVGPRPFETEDRDRFFGRTRELEELLSLIIAHRAVLVYAQSGAGKTSLLKAGVIPRLEEQAYKVLPPARVYGVLPTDLPGEEVTNIFVFHALQHWAADLCHGPSEKRAQTTLAEFLKTLVPPCRPDEESAAPMVIVFDQFEEFFTANTHRWQERGPFFKQLSQAQEEIPTLKVVFVMREEYIAQLDPLAELLPEKLRTRMHLERLRGNSARSAVVKPFQSRGLSFDAGAAEKLLAELSEIRVSEGDTFREAHGEFVEPVQLQVACQSLWENLEEDWKDGSSANSQSPHLITRDFVGRYGDVTHALAHYYDRSVKKAAAEGDIGEGELRRWVDKALITPTGTRGLAVRGASGAPGTIPGLALNCLEEAHLIRREDRGGTITHELTHDRFIEPVQTSNKAWLADYDAAEKIRVKLEERAAQNPDEILDELALREAEEYLTSPTAKILGATPEARLLVTRSRKQLEEAKKRQAEKLEEARRRAQEEERLRKAESERADAERARAEAITRARKWERIFGAMAFVLLVIITTFAWFLYEDVQNLKEKGRNFTNKAKLDLVDETNSIKNVTALRNLSLALNCNPKDTEAAKLARDLLVQRIWCPPTAGAEALYRQDALLAATFASGGSNNEIFAVAGNGQLLRWKGNELSPVRSLFEKPKPNDQQVVQPGFASFSPDGQWLLIIPPTLASAAIAETAVQGAPQPRAPPADASRGYEPCKVQKWRWMAQHQTYESAGADLEIPRLRGTRTTTFAWSRDLDRVVLTNWRGSDAECHLFEVGENEVKELPDRSAQLNGMKIAAISFSPDRSRIAAVSSERKVMLIGWEDLQVIPKSLNGQDSIQLPEGFQPNGVAFGPGDDELTLTSWSSIRTLNTRDGKLKPILPPTFRDQFMRIVFGPGDSATRLVAISFYGRVQVAKNARWQESAEPVVFRGSMGVPQFSPDGKRLLILSGGVWNVFDNMRLIDVSQLYRPQEAAPENFEGKPAPRWLAEIASAVSALDVGGDGSLLTLETVRKNHPESKAGDPYESVWRRFFPDEKNNGRLETGRQPPLPNSWRRSGENRARESHHGLPESKAITEMKRILRLHLKTTAQWQSRHTKRADWL
jgi:Novel STAND NTPase 1